MEKENLFSMKKFETRWSQDVMLVAEKKTTREKIMKRLWTSFVRDEFGLISSIQTQATFSYVLIIMDKVDDWITENE